jgi:hypothetical protein
MTIENRLAIAKCWRGEEKQVVMTIKGNRRDSCSGKVLHHDCQDSHMQLTHTHTHTYTHTHTSSYKAYGSGLNRRIVLMSIFWL